MKETGYQETDCKKTGWKEQNWVWMILLCTVLVICVGILLTLCADEGIDYDEAYSYQAARDYTQLGIVQKMIDDYDTDVPLYYNALRIWISLFGGIGHRFFAARLFSVAGAVASMLLGITVVRRNWGGWTALFFMIATTLAPAMLHVSVNIRMYSWTNFLVTAAALLVYGILQAPERKSRWILLGLCTAAGLFSHYFTAFAFALLYLFLLVALLRRGSKSWRSVFVCGGLPVAALVGWMVVSGFFHFVKTDSGEVEIKKLTVKGLLYYLFQTDMQYDLAIGVTLVATAFVGAAVCLCLFAGRRKAQGSDGHTMRNSVNTEDVQADRLLGCYAMMCIAVVFISYFAGLLLSSFASHFFIARHIMHATGIMWLGVAIVLPRISWQTYAAGLLVLLCMCHANYDRQYESAYRDTPYLEDTKVFIATQMEPGDIVIYSSPKQYYRLYLCYMPEQEFLWLKELTDDQIQALAGRRVWYFSTNWKEYFTDEQVERFAIRSENVGHYGFQIMNNCTDFDLLRLTIGGAQ
ncbi:MAG: glycosyltransferase family 39 protein [Lachnospiraceae bacterium]|nr:glycosyltransferase family 39 protein [Lachnospiraceae bacterium]